MRRRYITNACLSLVNIYRKFRKKLTPPLAAYPSSKNTDPRRGIFFMAGKGECDIRHRLLSRLHYTLISLGIKGGEALKRVGGKDIVFCRGEN